MMMRAATLAGGRLHRRTPPVLASTHFLMKARRTKFTNFGEKFGKDVRTLCLSVCVMFALFVSQSAYVLDLA